MATILDGKKLSVKLIDELTQKVAKLDRKPSLAVVLVGENPASQIYVGLKEKAAKKIGMNSIVVNYPESIDEQTLLGKIEELNSDPKINAILVQLPLPKHINAKNIIQAILPKKDADGVTPLNIGKISIGAEPYSYPCTPKGILLLLDEYKIQIEGKHVVVLGRSNIVGKPVAQMLLNRNATVTICHSYTENLSDITKTADILISAVGVKHIIKKDMVKNNAVIVDVGVTKNDVDGKIFGDVDLDVVDVASFITPCVGGVGPMTIASLMLNTFELLKLNLDDLD